MSDYALALHGGAGAKPGRDYAEVDGFLAAAIAAGAQALASGAAALDVVAEAVQSMEASGLFVAGRGARPDATGVAELDAAIMDGAAGRAGAVAAAPNLLSPIAAARAVMEQTNHVLIAGEGAAQFAREAGLGLVSDPSYWRTPVGVLSQDQDAGPGHGTVGATALDRKGRLAAATSTAGVWGKRRGRVGDSPLIGAGTWADEQVAVSCTGLGEAFILANAAADVSARLRYYGQDLQDAAESVLATVAQRGGDGGLIAVSRTGRIVFAFNTAGMKRARAGSRYAAEAGTFELRVVN